MVARMFLAVRTLERLHIAVGALACDGNGVDGNAARLRLFQRAEKTREGGFACTVMPVMATVSPSLMVMEAYRAQACYCLDIDISDYGFQ